MIRPLLSLGRLSLDEKRARIGYRHGKDAKDLEWMDYLEFIARVTSHIPDKGQVTVGKMGYTPMPIGGRSRRRALRRWTKSSITSS
jgi:hypothetical protein